MTTPLRMSAASNEPDQLSGRIARLKVRQKIADEESAEINRERVEIQRLQREALADQPRRAAVDDEPRQHSRRAEPVAEGDDLVTDGISDPVGFARSAMRAAAMARGEKV